VPPLIITSNFEAEPGWAITGVKPRQVRIKYVKLFFNIWIISIRSCDATQLCATQIDGVDLTGDGYLDAVWTEPGERGWAVWIGDGGRKTRSLDAVRRR